MALGLAVAAILVLTLRPAGPGSHLGVHPLCLACGDVPLANAVRNVVLFVPAGVALGFLLGRVLPVALAALALTLGIEAAQFVVPGRNPLLVDVLTNATGGALGGWLGVHLPRILAPPPRLATRLAAAGSLAATAVLARAGWLLAPVPPERELAVSLAPLGPPPAEAEPTAEDPRPRVLEARLVSSPPGSASPGPERLRHGPHPDSPALARAVRGLVGGWGAGGLSPGT
ncbi:MAG: VanZ family protein, partial [Gemmatimonadales bacterium]